MTRSLLSLEDAVAALLAATPAPACAERAPLAASLRRVAAETRRARYAQPPFNRSPLDGFALRHGDTAGASAAAPARLAVVADVFAGDAAPPRVGRGEAVRIMTGAPLPEGADCVVRQEDAAADGGFVLVPRPLGAFENYCPRGELLEEGGVLAREGERIDPGVVALLAGDGAADVAVFPRPRIGILSTGDELARGGGAPAPGSIHDSNLPLLSARAEELGAVVAARGTEGDDTDRIAAALAGMRPEVDLIVTTGGVSVGARDRLPDAADAAGARRLFHGVAVKPGSPALAAVLDGVPVLCLSGNPFAAFVTFALLAEPVLRRLAGLRDAAARRVACRLGEAFPKRGGMRRFAPGRLDGGVVRFPGGRTGSRSVAALVGADCLVDIPPGEGGMAAGADAEAVLL